MPHWRTTVSAAYLYVAKRDCIAGGGLTIGGVPSHCCNPSANFESPPRSSSLPASPQSDRFGIGKEAPPNFSFSFRVSSPSRFSFYLSLLTLPRTLV